MAGATVQGYIADLVVPVDGEVICQGEHLLNSIIDEDETDEGAEAFLREASEILHQVAGFGRHQNEAKEGHPKSNPEAEF